MTEQEWLASTDPTPLLRYLQEQQISDRKMRLLACACCRDIWEHLPHPRSRLAVEVAERFVDGQATPKELAQARGFVPERMDKPAWAPYWATNTKASGPLWNVFAIAAEVPAKAAALRASGQQAARLFDSVQATRVRGQVELIREVIGNPFRPFEVDASWLSWEGGIVLRLAEGIYLERAFERMPILGDALEEAGCAQSSILEHCRRAETHVRGCWVLDLILGKD